MTSQARPKQGPRTEARALDVALVERWPETAAIQGWRRLYQVAFLVLAAFASGATVAQHETAAEQPPAGASAPIPSDQMDSLVAPIALYPDPLLAQTLAASTYPLEIIQLQQWLAKNQELKGEALAAAAEKEPWDPSVQALAAFPEVVKRLADDIQWTTDLGNAFLAQQKDVMAAVQRMRSKAQANGNLKSGEQQTVQTKTVESQQVIVIEQASPDVVYVPSYNPTVVYGAPAYPYPPIYYPPPGSLAVSFGVGMAMGAWMSGGWGWGAGWGHGDVYINNNNSFVRNSNVNRSDVNRNNINRAGGAGNRWQHNPQHRGGAPYRDRTTADLHGGTARGDSLANREAAARQQLNRQGGDVAANRGAGAGAGSLASSDRAGGANLGASDRGGAGGADRVGGRDLSSNTAAGGNRAFDGGFDGSRAGAASTRGASSTRSAGGGFRGAGVRGGGGGRRR